MAATYTNASSTEARGQTPTPLLGQTQTNPTQTPLWLLGGAQEHTTTPACQSQRRNNAEHTE